MSGAYIASATPVGSSSGGTTSAIDTSGANLIVLPTIRASIDTLTVTDSKFNTWTSRTEYGSSAPYIRFYDCYAPTVGSGHTFTISGASSYPQIGAIAFSGAASSPFDQISGRQTSDVNIYSPGSITPSGDGYIVVTAVTWWDPNANGLSVDSGFSTPVQSGASAGVKYGGAFAYLIQGAAAAVNPQWTAPVNYVTVTPTQASYKISTGGAPAFIAGAGLMLKQAVRRASVW